MQTTPLRLVPSTAKIERYENRGRHDLYLCFIFTLTLTLDISELISFNLLSILQMPNSINLMPVIGCNDSSKNVENTEKEK